MKSTEKILNENYTFEIKASAGLLGLYLILSLLLLQACSSAPTRELTVEEWNARTRALAVASQGVNSFYQQQVPVYSNPVPMRQPVQYTAPYRPYQQNNPYNANNEQIIILYPSSSPY